MRNKTTAGLLALFLGGIGMHKFYLGQWVRGIVYLLFCWTFVPAIIGFVEAIFLFASSEDRFQAAHGSKFGYVMTASGPVAASPKLHVKCPGCRELIFKEASKCKHCGTALIPQ
jgi:TM2 domain-containing membrane protein YozV